MGRTIAELADEVIKALDLFHAPKSFLGMNGELCISLEEDGKNKTMSLKSEQWRSWLIRFLRRINFPAPPSLREEITEALKADAYVGDKEKVFVRVARTDESVQIDLNDNSFNVVYIPDSGGGFQITQPKCVYLVRPNKQLPLPVPVACDRREFIKMFKKLIPPLDCGHWLLVLVFILKSLNRDRGAFVILSINGPQGSGKTRLSFCIKMLVDPSDPSFLSPPRNEDDIVVAAKNSYMPVWENLSEITAQEADVLCRLSTGGGISKRQLYTNDEEAFYKLHSPAIINGINDLSNRPDLKDRTVTLDLKPMANGQRVAETELNKEFDANRPKLLAGIYDLLAECLQILPTIQISAVDLPRMTDYALMGIAAERVLNLEQGLFLKEYAKNRNEQDSKTFWTDDLCIAIYNKLTNIRPSNSPLEGTAQELMNALFGKGHSSFGKGPRTAKGFSDWLRRITPTLRTMGIEVERLPRTTSKRSIVIRAVVPLSPVTGDSSLGGQAQNGLVRPSGITAFQWKKMKAEYEAMNGKSLSEVVNETDDL